MDTLAMQTPTGMSKGLQAPPVLAANPLPLTITLAGGDASADLSITRLSHACVLIKCGDTTLLTDPWFSEKPLYYHGESLPMNVGDLPKLSGVLSSMNHYDHFDVRSFAACRDPGVPFLTIAGSPQTELAKGAGFANVVPVAAGSSARIGNMTLHAFAANDFSPAAFRYEQSYVIESGGRTILFSPHFPKAAAIAAIKARFGRVDVALLGVNGLRIKPLLGRQLSMDPEDAARVCATLGVSVAIPIHYAFNGGWVSSTFLLTHKGTPERFAEATRAIAPHTAAVTLSPGQPLVIKARA